MYKARKNIRLKNWDYSSDGWYFITICTKNFKCILGNVEKNEVVLSKYGEIVRNEWEKLPNRYETMKLAEFVIMPNHIHGIIIIERGSRGNPRGYSSKEKAGTRPAPTTLGDIIGGFKSITTNAYILKVKEEKWKPFDKQIWHRNYYEHIIRNERDYLRIRRYIQDNPRKWC